MTGFACDAAVVGAGPAGSAAATRLASAGFRVVLLEKDLFPRAKVCGEFLAADALASLDRLGAREAVDAAGPERIVRGRIHLPGGEAVPFDLPEPAMGLSRELLDDLLARRAAAAGADLRTAARVVAIAGSPAAGFTLRVAATGFSDLRASVVVGAWGRWDALDRSFERPFLARSRKFFGWNLHLSGDSAFLEGEVRLYLFRGGYCGLSRVEHGQINLAGVIAEGVRRRLGPGWESVLEHARRANRALASDLDGLSPAPRGFLGTGPVFFTAKPPTERGVLMTGDAAGVLDPFSGEGQASALASGLLAGDTAARALTGEIGMPDLPRVYARQWRLRFARRFVWSALFRRMMLHPALGSAAARVAGRSIVELAARSLGR